jgi:hypothetical protein
MSELPDPRHRDADGASSFGIPGARNSDPLKSNSPPFATGNAREGWGTRQVKGKGAHLKAAAPLNRPGRKNRATKTNRTPKADPSHRSECDRVRDDSVPRSGAEKARRPVPTVRRDGFRRPSRSVKTCRAEGRGAT